MFSSPFSKVSLVLDIRCLKQVKARRREFGEIYQVYSKLKWFPGPSLGFPKYLIWLFVISLVSLSLFFLLSAACFLPPSWSCCRMPVPLICPSAHRGSPAVPQCQRKANFPLAKSRTVLPGSQIWFLSAYFGPSFGLSQNF